MSGAESECLLSTDGEFSEVNEGSSSPTEITAKVPLSWDYNYGDQTMLTELKKCEKGNMVELVNCKQCGAMVF